MTLDLDARFPHTGECDDDRVVGYEGPFACSCDRDARIAAHIAVLEDQLGRIPGVPVLTLAPSSFAARAERAEAALRTIRDDFPEWHLVDGEDGPPYCSDCGRYEGHFEERPCLALAIEALMAELGEG